MSHTNHVDETAEAQTENNLRTDGGTDKGNQSNRALAQIQLNRNPVEINAVRPTVKEILAATKRTPPEDFDVFRLDHEGDTEGTKIDLTETIDRASEQSTVFLRAAENNRNAGR